MPRPVIIALAASLLATSALRGAAPAAPPDSPHWIWLGTERDRPAAASIGGRPVQLATSFRLAGRPRRAILQVANDFCHATVELNGRAVLRVEDFSPTVRIDVADSVRPDDNRIVIRGRRTEGPVAVALSLEVTDDSGQTTTIVSDARWTAAVDGRRQAAREPASSYGPVAPALWGRGARPAAIDEFDDYEQWRQARGAGDVSDTGRFWTAAGFEIELLRVAGPDEGSWVGLAFDPQGRLTIAREDRGLLRMTLSDDGRSIARVEPIDDDLEECRGLLYAHGALYANANNSKGLYSLRDTNGDDRFDRVERLREFPGGVGHGRNSLALGPDGMIYSIHGDSVDLPAEEIDDRTSPFREARRGQRTHEGSLVRTDPDGARWELLCGGMRNPFGIALNLHGDLFTYDADNEFDMGAPWYRPTRLLHLVSGADFGWRGSLEFWPPYDPDQPRHALPTLDLGHGSPTAAMFGTSSHFPPPWRDAMFLLDWAYGRILAVHVTPRGAGYRAQAETFVKGRPLNVTDLAFGPDGAMYVVTGGRQTQAALYRIASAGPPSEPPPVTPQQQARDEHAASAREVRAKLESFHGCESPGAVEAVWPSLDSPDPTIRHAARVALEHQPLEHWYDRALAETRPRAALTAWLALAGSGQPPVCAEVVERALTMRFDRLDLDGKLALLSTYTLACDAAPAAVEERRDRIIAQLAPHFPDSSGAFRHVSPSGAGESIPRELSRLLLRLGAPSAVATSMALLAASRAQEDELHYLLVLRGARQGWTPELRRAYFTALNGTSRYRGGQGMPGFLARIREEAVATLSPDERAGLADLLEPEPEPDLVPPARPFVKEWTLADLAPRLADRNRSPDLARGEAVFREALCIRCHRVGARGPAVGPDLSYVGRRFSRRDILESILEPDRVVAENYRNVSVQTHDGRVVVGRILTEGDFRSQELRIATDPLKPSEVAVVDKRDVEEHRLLETSPMPAGLLNSFTAEEILDLLAYLEAGAGAAESP